MSQEATALFWKGDYQKVIDILTPLEETGMLTEVDIRVLVYSLHALARYEEAEAIVHRHPDSRLVDYLHVYILEKTGRLSEAESKRQKALDYVLERLKDAQPGQDKAYWLNAVGLLQTDLKTKIEYYEMSLKEDPDDFVVEYNLADSLKIDGQIDKALKHARRSVELKPEYATALRLVTQLEDAQRERESQEIDSRPTTADSSTSEHSLRRKKASEDKVSSELEKSLSSLKTENATLKTAKAELNCELDDLTIQNENNLQRIAEMESQLSDLKTQLSGRDASLEEKDQVIKQLQIAQSKYDEEKERLIKQNLTLEGEYAVAKCGLELKIASVTRDRDNLEAQNAELSRELHRLKEWIKMAWPEKAPQLFFPVAS